MQQELDYGSPIKEGSKSYLKKKLFEQIWELNEMGNFVGRAVDVLPFVYEFSEKDQEHFVVVLLDGGHRIIKVECVSIGMVNRTLVHPREIFRPAIRENAVAVILVHNHPSGSLEPSEEDKKVTKVLYEAGDLLGIRVLDHIIISKMGHYSFLENGEI